MTNQLIKQLLMATFLCFSLFPLNLLSSDLGILSETANLKEIWPDEDDFDALAGLEADLQTESFERNKDLDSLFKAKYKIINGDFKYAKFFLSRIDDKKSKLTLIKYRYLGIIAFIEGNFTESLNYLSDKKFFSTSFYPKICLLKLINFMAINDLTSLKNERESCLDSAIKKSKNGAYWAEGMVKLKLKELPQLKKSMLVDINHILTDDEISRIWLKMGLYLNKQEEVLALINYLPESSYQSKRLREILAFMYLRTNTIEGQKKALSFIDDIDSANAENIKGNINMQNKEYELAFGHFRLALQKKLDSSNSLDMATPLAWILNQWKDGLSMLDNNTNKNVDPRKKKAIRIAFLIRDKNFTSALKELSLLKIEFQNGPPLEVNLMDNYLSLILSESEKDYDHRKNEEVAEKSCKSFDGISCWISLQFIQWNNLGKLTKKDETIEMDKEFDLQFLKEKKEIRPLKEIINVDQQDIEELDSATIQIEKSLK